MTRPSSVDCRLSFMKSSPASTSDYLTFVAELKTRIASARLLAARAVNRELVALYWDLGRAIAEKQQTARWGDSVVERLARDLRGAYPDMRGFSANNLWLVRQLYLEYSRASFLEQLAQELKERGRRAPEQATAEAGPSRASPEEKCATAILEQPVQESIAALDGSERCTGLPSSVVKELITAIPWGHHVELLKKIKIPAARLYYLRATARFGWSRNVLLNQIKAGAYERSLQAGKAHNFPLALPGHLAEQAEEALKSSYNLEFLGLGRAVKEREIEDRLVRRLRDFILELGYGFCFVGRQYRLTLGAKEYFVDLLFYHRFLKALVAIDLKVGAFAPEFAGKMDFYLNLLNDRERAADDRPSIGIILCAEKDNLEVEYALKTKANPIGVAEYRLQPKLPADLRGKLPTARQLSAVIRPILPA